MPDALVQDEQEHLIVTQLAGQKREPQQSYEGDSTRCSEWLVSIFKKRPKQ